MDGYQASTFEGVEFSVAFTAATDLALTANLVKGPVQEDLTFAYWHPSSGQRRFTAILHSLILPHGEQDRMLHGNVAFTANYIQRVIDDLPAHSGIALLHSHLGPGWQDLSDEDIIAERDRLAGLVASATHLPLLGLTRGTDGTWSARFWLRVGRHKYERRWAQSVRSVGRHLRLSFHPTLRPPPTVQDSQVATVSVWGQRQQEDLARARIGVVGLGSVGSIVAEALSRVGVQQITLIDHDRVEVRNLDRTLGAYPQDASAQLHKVEVSKRLVEQSHTSAIFRTNAIPASLATAGGLAAALDCDALVSCVDRPWPRHILNAVAYAHLIPVVDGGILARVNAGGRLLHVDWRIHTVGPERPCLYCLDALRRSDAALDREGMLDDPDYIKGLSAIERERYGRRNVFPFSLSVAAHQVLQAVALITGSERVGGVGPQTYHAYPGEMFVTRDRGECDVDCDIAEVTSSASAILGE